MYLNCLVIALSDTNGPDTHVQFYCGTYSLYFLFIFNRKIVARLLKYNTDTTLYNKTKTCTTHNILHRQKR